MTCQESSIVDNMIANGCFVDNSFFGGGVPDCIYFDSMKKGKNGNCSLLSDNDLSAGFSVPLCNGAGFGGRGTIAGPGLRLLPKGSTDYDANLDLSPFYAQVTQQAYDNQFFNSNIGNARYYLKAVTFLVDPCLPVRPFAEDNTIYCSDAGESGVAAVWWGRAYLSYMRDSSWEMVCNRPINIIVSNDANPSPDPLDQLGLRTMVIAPEGAFGLRRVGYVHFILGDGGNCFQLMDWSCLSDNCNAGTTQPEEVRWNCDGETDTSRTNAWKVIEIDYVGDTESPGIAFSLDNARFPHNNPANLQLKNDILATFGHLRDGQDGRQQWEIMHDPSLHNGNEKSGNVNLWRNGFAFTTSAIPPDSSIAENPPVRYGGTGDVIPITLTSLLTGLTFGATLTLADFLTTLTFNLDRGPDGTDQTTFRIAATLGVFVGVRIRLNDMPANLAAANGYPYTFRAPNDQFDFRTVDSYERLYARDPRGAIVPHRQPDNPETGGIFWRGLVAPHPFGDTSVQRHSFEVPPREPDISGAGLPALCCSAMWAADALVIPGEVDNHNEPFGPRRYAGAAAISVRDLHDPGVNPCFRF